jgi:glycosyltransferase involved in cell wall biosynthesis
VQLTFLGSLEESKGVLELIEACRRLSQDGFDFRLVVGGRGRAEPAARALVTKHSLAERVTFVGWVEGLQLETLWRTSHVFVLPSWTEGFPNALIEAMACGMAVVTTPVGSIPDYLEDGVHGVFVRPKDPAALAEALRLLLTEPQLRQQFGLRAHELARDVFGTKVSTNRFADVIMETITGS